MLVVISGNTAGLQTALASATGSLSAFNKNANTLGNALTRTMTLPLLALGGASIKLASDFQAAMARVQGLTPILDQTGMSIDQLSNIILDMSKEVPTAPTELANALYFAGSAGLAASEALEVVNLAAKGAAIGMGTAADISKVLIFALNAYRPTGLTAAEAMDTLTVAIREGTAEPDELAGALGRLIPVAMAAGVEFDQVVGSIAALTNIGFPTRVATVALRALFAQLLAPTIQATENLAQLGITSTELREALMAGPVVAFDLLLKSTKGNFDVLRNIIPQIRGFSAFLGLTGDQAERASKIFRATANSTGALDRAFAIMSKTTQFKFAIALNQLRIAGIQLGTQLFPVFRALGAGLGELGETFQDMPQWAQKSVAAFIVLGAAAGPLIKVWALLNAEGAGFLATGKSMAAGILVLAAAVGIAVGSLRNLATGGGDLVTVLIALGAGFVAARIAVQLLFNAVNAGLLGTSSFTVALTGLLSRANLIAVVLTVAATAIAMFAGQQNKAAQEAAELGHALAGMGASATLSVSALRQLPGELGDLEAVFTRVAKRAGALGLPLAEGIEKTRQQVTQSVSNIVSQLDVEGTAVEATVGKLVSAGGSVQDLANIVAQDGENIDEFMTRLSGTTGIGFADAQGIENLTELLQLSRALSLAQEDLEANAMGRIAMFAAEEGAVEDLAQKYGVSVEDIKTGLQEVGGVTATSLGEGEDMWAQQAGFVDETTGAIVGAREAMEAFHQEMVAERQASMRGDILGGFFDPEAIAKAEGSVESLLGTARRNAGSMVAMADNVSELLRRGLDPSVLQHLVDQGPAMVEKFVDASGGQLRRLETAYFTTMGAIDATILNEGRHQEGKASNMIASFAEAMLSNAHLPQGAAQRIVNQVGDAFSRGRIDRFGMIMIERVAAGIKGAEGVTRQAAARVVQGVASAIVAGDFKGAGGRGMIDLAQGIAANAGVPKGRVAMVTKGIIIAMAGLPQSAYTMGLQAMAQLAAGIIAAGVQAASAAHSAAASVNAAMREAFHGSPKLFTFYLGQDLMGQLAEGMNKASITLPGVGGYGRGAAIGSRTFPAPTDLADGGWGGSGSRRIQGSLRINWEEGRAFIDARADGVARAYDRQARRRQRVHKG